MVLKHKKAHQLTCTVVLTGLLANTLLTSRPLNGGQFHLATQRKFSKIEIEQKIKAIKKIVTRFNIAEIALPSFVLAAGAGIAVAVVTSLLIIPAIKYKKALKLFTEGTKNISEKATRKEAYIKITDVIDFRLKNLLKPKDIARIETHIYKGFYRIPSETAAWDTKKDAAIIRDIATWFKKNIIANSLATAAISYVVAIALLKLADISTTLARFGLSTTSVATALDNVKELEEIERKNPGTLTEQQKNILSRFEKLQQNPLVQGIIKNAQLRSALKKVVITAMRHYPSLVRRVGTKKADTLFATYIKLRWRKRTLQKTLDQYTAMKRSELRSRITKRQLSKTKQKIATLDTRYPLLQLALESAVQNYSRQANTILEELKKKLLKTIKTKEFALPEPQSAIPL